MPRYFFIAQRPDIEKDDPHGTILPDDAAALLYAERIIGDLRKAGGGNNDGLTVIVRNERLERVLSIPFLPACA
jgi:hypothetical protein